MASLNTIVHQSNPLSNPQPKKLATIRPTVLSSSRSRMGRPDFQGRTSLALVLSDCQFLFKVAHKDVPFCATNNPNGTVTLTNPAGFLSLTVAGHDIIRLCDKAGVDVDEPFITNEELNELYEEPQPEFIPPSQTSCEDYADFANATLGSYYASPQEPTITRKLPNGKWERGQKRHTPKRRNRPAPRRITRKEPTNKGRFPTPAAQSAFEQDVALLWGGA